jgi:hypothetical protein
MKISMLGVLAVLVVPVVATSATGAESESDAVKYTAEGQLVKPADYRQWPLIGTGLGMAYGPLRETPSGRPPFTNVFVNPSSYRAFLQTGAWPDKTLFILEVREPVPVNNSASGANGYFQGEITGIEAEVKDEGRFPGKWAFFNLGKSSAGALIPAAASCYSCHATNAAVENTFVQFYPVLRDVAKEKGTLKKVPERF